MCAFQSGANAAWLVCMCDCGDVVIGTNGGMKKKKTRTEAEA